MEYNPIISVIDFGGDLSKPSYWCDWCQYQKVVVFGGAWSHVPDLDSHASPEPEDCELWAEMHGGLRSNHWKQSSDRKARKTDTPANRITTVFKIKPKRTKPFTPDTPEVAATRATILAKKLQLSENN